MEHSESYDDDDDDDDDVTIDSSATESDDSSATETDSGIEHENDDVLSSESCPFLSGEKVFAYHNTRIYEAKVINTQFNKEDNEWLFFIHYVGWKKSWDEWVRQDRLLKYTEENVLKQQLINKQEGTDKNPKLSRTSQTRPKEGRGKKRKNESVVKGAVRMEELLFQMPHALRKQLVADCESVTHLGKHVKLPRTPNVDDILKKYLEYKSKSDDLKAHSVEEILKGLCCYFDKALPVMLLYKNERPQYEKAISENVSPSSVYGAEHLLRLFVKLPELLVEANIEEETLKELLKRLVDFLKFLHKNQSAFFLSSYHVPEDTGISTSKQAD